MMLFLNKKRNEFVENLNSFLSAGQRYANWSLSASYRQCQFNSKQAKQIVKYKSTSMSLLIVRRTLHNAIRKERLNLRSQIGQLLNKSCKTDILSKRYYGFNTPIFYQSLKLNSYRKRIKLKFSQKGGGIFCNELSFIRPAIWLTVVSVS